MSFDIYLQRFASEPSSEELRERVWEVLESVEYSGPDENGFYVVEFTDGVEVEFSADELEGEGDFTSCGFFVREISSPLVEFVFNVAKAGDMIIMPVMEDSVVILTSEAQKKTMPTELNSQQDPLLCDSYAELEAMLTGGYAGWRRNRDQILPPPPDSRQ